MKIIVMCLNAVLLALAIGVVAILLNHGDAWKVITAYWIVTVVKNAIVLVNERARS